ncbi:MAG: hypothetical protein ACREDQ_08180 [Limisphaerales bacterium]
MINLQFEYSDNFRRQKLIDGLLVGKDIPFMAPCNVPNMIDTQRLGGSRFMRISRFIATAALMVAFVFGCSKRVSQFSSVPDLGVVYFSGRPIPQQFDLGGGTNCIIEGVTNYQAFGMTSYQIFGKTNYEGFLVYVKFQATNSDRAVHDEDMGWLPATLGQKAVYSGGGFSVQFTPKYKAR